MNRTTDRRNAPGPRWTSLLIAVALLPLLRPATCNADLTITAGPVTAAPGTTGSFDVYLTNTGTSAVDVSSDIVTVDVSGVPGVTLTGVSIATQASPYIYAISGTTYPGADPLSDSTFPSTSFTASDTDFSALGYQEVEPGQSYGLAHVSYSVAASAAPGVGSILIDASNSSLSGQDYVESLDFTAGTADFTVAPMTSTPEPSSLLLATVGGLAIACWARRAGGNRRA